jgi:hypothetical protein
MNIEKALALQEKYAECPKCGNSYVGNGEGKLIIDDGKYAGKFHRSCKCGWSITTDADGYEINTMKQNKYDRQRRDQLLKTLAKAKEQAENAALYLTANERPIEEVYAVEDALEHITIALEHLGVKEESTC